MLGAIIGDIVGSKYEFDNIRTKEFELFDKKECFFTDDSIMTLAIAKALIECNKNYENLEETAIKYMQALGRKYPYCGFGGMFYNWIFSDNPMPYNSFGNGSAMRISAVGWVGNSEDEVEKLATAVTKISHNHPEGIKGAVVTAMCIYYARIGKSKEFIKKYASKYYDLNFNYISLKSLYKFNETCQNTVPQAIYCFLISNDFEDAIRTAISIGGDSDTLAAITGGIAEAYYKILDDIKNTAISFLDDELKTIYFEFVNKFLTK